MVILAAAAGLAGALAAAGPSAAAPLMALPASSAPGLPAGAQRIGPVPAGTAIHLVVTLKVQDQAGLDTLLAGQANPNSPLFHQFLAPGEFAKRFGATAAQVSAVETALKDAGLDPGPVSANGLAISVSGSAAAIGGALHTSLVSYQLPAQRKAHLAARAAYANATAPQLPASAASLVTGIVGLNTLYQRQSLAVRPVRRAGVQGAAQVAASATGPQACPAARAAASANTALTPSQLAAHYGLAPLYGLGDLGKGQRVALVEFEPNLASDVSSYKSCYGIGTTVSYVTVDGGAGTGAGSGEAALDIEDVAGLAPGAAVDVYQAPNTDAGNYDAYQQVIAADTAKTISTSWGLCEADDSPSDESAQEALFEQASAQGQTVLAAAGDAGSTACLTAGGADASALNALTPGSLPYVVSVGGTTLNAKSEVTWNESAIDEGAGGGGLSNVWCMPAYQDQAAIPGLVNAHSKAGSNCPAGTGPYWRQVPDISADADPETGYVIDYDGSWTPIGGTSAAAPLLAAVAALTDASPFCAAYGSGDPGLLPAGLYAAISAKHSYVYPSSGHAQGLNDITSGNNDYTPSGYTGRPVPGREGLRRGDRPRGAAGERPRRCAAAEHLLPRPDRADVQAVRHQAEVHRGHRRHAGHRPGRAHGHRHRARVGVPPGRRRRHRPGRLGQDRGQLHVRHHVHGAAARVDGPDGRRADRGRERAGQPGHRGRPLHLRDAGAVGLVGDAREGPGQGRHQGGHPRAELHRGQAGAVRRGQGGRRQGGLAHGDHRHRPGRPRHRARHGHHRQRYQRQHRRGQQVHLHLTGAPGRTAGRWPPAGLAERR